MDLAYNKEHSVFRQDLRAFLSEHWTGGVAKVRENSGGDLVVFRRLATSRGYLYRSIPFRFGGSEQPPDLVKAQIIAEEFALARAPMEVGGVGMMLLVPTLLECGAEWQKEKFVRKTIEGEYKWAQGYSEPGSGSDLASLNSRAELIGDQWVINGHKIWTTRAHEANFMFALLRSEPEKPRHDGLSYILFDFKQPGVKVRPIHQINGGREFCEVFLEDVRTPADWIVGRRGEGWAVSKSTLKHERNAIGSASRSLPVFKKLLALARETMIDGKPAIQDPIIRDRLAVIEGHVQAQIYSGYYQLTLATRDESPGILGYCNKINTTNIFHKIAEVASDILDDSSLQMPSGDNRRDGNEKWVNQILGSLGLSIAGGTSNIQRNIIAERGLNLPRDAHEV